MNTAVAKYRQDKAFVLGLSIRDAARLMKHGNPVIRRAAEHVMAMADAHRRGNHLPGLDAQWADDILNITSVEEIRAAIA